MGCNACNRTMNGKGCMGKIKINGTFSDRVDVLDKYNKLNEVWDKFQ